MQYNLRKHCQAKHKMVYPPISKQYVMKLSDTGSDAAKKATQPKTTEAKRSKRQKEIIELCNKLEVLSDTLQTPVVDEVALQQGAMAAQTEVDKLCESLDLQSASGAEKGSMVVTPLVVNKLQEGFEMQAKEECQLHTSNGEELNFEVLEFSSTQVVKLEAESAEPGQVMYIVEGGGANSSCVVAEPHLPEVVDHEEVAQIVRVVEQHDARSTQAGAGYIIDPQYRQVPDQ